MFSLSQLFSQAKIREPSVTVVSDTTAHTGRISGFFSFVGGWDKFICRMQRRSLPEGETGSSLKRERKRESSKLHVSIETVWIHENKRRRARYKLECVCPCDRIGRIQQNSSLPESHEGKNSVSRHKRVVSNLNISWAKI